MNLLIMVVNFTSEGSQGEYQVILKEVWMSVVEHGACQEQLRRTRLGSFFQLDQESFICAGGQVDRDMCTVSGDQEIVTSTHPLLSPG